LSRLVQRGPRRRNISMSIGVRTDRDVKDGSILSPKEQRPPREFPRYDWPGYVSTRRVVGAFVVAAVVVAFGVIMCTRPATCGSVEMRPGDLCSINGGTGASYSDISSSPVRQPAIYALIALAIIGYAIVRLIRRRPPTAEEINKFQAAVVSMRRGLVIDHNLRAAQGRATPETLSARLARFEHDVEKERERAGPRKRQTR
jgi:hypothetical protein